MGKRRSPLVEGARPDEGARLRYATAIDELDLHGKTVEQANRAIRNFLQRIARQYPGDVVRIITGRGINSDGPPQLRKALEREVSVLDTIVAEWERAVDGGSYLIRMR